MKKSKLVRKNFYVTEHQWSKFEILAEATGLTISEHIRRAIDAYLDDYSKPSIMGECDAKERFDFGGSKIRKETISGSW